MKKTIWLDKQNQFDLMNGQFDLMKRKIWLEETTRNTIWVDEKNSLTSWKKQLDLIKKTIWLDEKTTWLDESENLTWRNN